MVTPKERKIKALTAILLFIAPFFIQLVHAEVHHHAGHTHKGIVHHEADCLINSYEFQPHYLLDHNTILKASPFIVGTLSYTFESSYISYPFTCNRLRAPPSCSCK